MNTGRNTPSIDPALQDTLAGSVQFAFNKLMQGVDGMLPCHVIAYDAIKNSVQVKIDIMLVTVSGEVIPRQQISGIPVLKMGGGGFFLNFPLKEGDRGWVVASDRDLSLFLKNYSESPPNTGLIKNFSSALFIPDIMTGYTINIGEEDACILSTVDGAVRIVLSDSGVKIFSPLTTINGDLQVTGQIDAQGGMTATGGSGTTFSVNGDLELTGNYTQTGNMTVDGDITATGTITPGVEIANISS